MYIAVLRFLKYAMALKSQLFSSRDASHSFFAFFLASAICLAKSRASRPLDRLRCAISVLISGMSTKRQLVTLREQDWHRDARSSMLMSDMDNSNLSARALAFSMSCGPCVHHLPHLEFWKAPLPVEGMD